MYQDWDNGEGQIGDWVKELYQERAIMLGVYNNSRRINHPYSPTSKADWDIMKRLYVKWRDACFAKQKPML